MAKPINKAVANLKRKLAQISNPRERAAVVRALRGVSRAVNQELGQIRPGGRGREVPPWITVPSWV